MPRFLMVSFFFVSLKCLSQPSPIKGKVTVFPTDIALSGANVRSMNQYHIGTTTDSEGEFELAITLDDTLMITYTGFEVLKIPVRAISNCSVNTSLKPFENHIPEIEISAERFIAEEFTVRKISRMDIYTNPSAKADPILAVNSTPSATTIDESANISLRGSGPSETGIFLNNVPVNNAVRYSQLNGIGTFSIFNTALINNVLVYPGNPPLEYGNSTSGIIAIQTDEVIPQKPVNTLSVTLASIGIFTSRKLSDKSSLTLFSNYQPSLFIKSLNHRAMKDIRTFSSGDLAIHYFKKIKSHTTIRLFNYSLQETYMFHYEQPTYNGIFLQNKTRNFTVGNVRRQIGRNEFSFNHGLSLSKANYNYGITDIHLTLHDVFASVNFLHKNINSEWKTGIAYDHRSSDFAGSFPTYEFATGEKHPSTYNAKKNELTNPECYGYYKRNFGSHWTTGAGIRKNIPATGLNSYLGIQANIHYNFNDYINFNLAAGKYHKYQLPQEDADLPFVINCNQYSADMNFSGSKTEAAFSIFHKTNHTDTKNYRVRGIEIFTKHIFANNFRSQLSFTGLSAKESQGNISRPSPYNIHYFIRGNIEYKIEGTWTISSVFLFRQGSYYYSIRDKIFNEQLMVYQPFYNTQPERLPPYNNIDVSISKILPLTKKAVAIAFVSAGNIINCKNIRDYTYNFDYTIRKSYLFSQRTFYFGLVINF